MKKAFIGLAILGVLIVAYTVLDGFLFDGVRAQKINEQGFQANYFAHDTLSNQACVVLIGGGQWGDYWASEFARRGYAAFSLPYAGAEGLPALPEEIELAYFEKALNWLANQAAVNADKIVLMGASRNAELSLVLASRFPELQAAVRYLSRFRNERGYHSAHRYVQGSHRALPHRRKPWTRGNGQHPGD